MARKVEPSRSSIYIRKIRIFKKDIQAIHDLLLDYGVITRIKTKEYIYDSIQEFFDANMDQNIDELMLRANRDDKDLDVHLEPLESSIWHYSDVASIGAASKLKEFLNEHKVYPNFLLNGWLRLLVASCAIILTYAINKNMIGDVWLLSLPFAWLWVFGGELKWLKPQGCVSAAEAPSGSIFASSFAKDLIKVVVSALLGGIVSYIVVISTKKCS